MACTGVGIIPAMALTFAIITGGNRRKFQTVTCPSCNTQQVVFGVGPFGVEEYNCVPMERAGLTPLPSEPHASA